MAIISNATTIADFTYEASGILQDIDQDILETRIVQYASLSSQLSDSQISSYTNNDDDNHVDDDDTMMMIIMVRMMIL